MKLLIVESNEDLGLSMAEFLEECGHTVTHVFSLEVGSAEHALHGYEKRIIGLPLDDAERDSGHDELKAWATHGPLIVLDPSITTPEGRGNGSPMLLPKPCSMAMLVKAVTAS
jgi:DNA-binding response OmpR family regulator